MIRSIAIAATLIAAIPAIAGARPATSSARAAITVISAEAAANPNTRYCVKAQIPGSLIPRKICNTRAQWLARGTDPLIPSGDR